MKELKILDPKTAQNLCKSFIFYQFWWLLHCMLSILHMNIQIKTRSRLLAFSPPSSFNAIMLNLLATSTMNSHVPHFYQITNYKDSQPFPYWQRCYDLLTKEILHAGSLKWKNLQFPSTIFQSSTADVSLSFTFFKFVWSQFVIMSLFKYKMVIC